MIRIRDWAAMIYILFFAIPLIGFWLRVAEAVIWLDKRVERNLSDPFAIYIVAPAIEVLMWPFGDFELPGPSELRAEKTNNEEA